MDTPKISLCGLQYQRIHLPHIWTSTHKTFTITFQVPSEEPTLVNCRLFGIQRCKFNEDKYNRCTENQPEEEEMVPVQDATLSISSVSTTRATVSPSELKNDFLCTVLPQEGMKMQVFVITFECLRNHWERSVKEKFMMFALQIVVNGKFVSNLRLYSQKTAPQSLDVSREDMSLNMTPIQPKQDQPIRISVSPPVPRKPKAGRPRNERFQKEPESVVYNSSPEAASSSDSDNSDSSEKLAVKRRFEDVFILDTSPLPEELILVWSNVLNYCSDDSPEEYSPVPMINTFPVTIDLTDFQPEKRMRYYVD